MKTTKWLTLLLALCMALVLLPGAGGETRADDEFYPVSTSEDWNGALSASGVDSGEIPIRLLNDITIDEAFLIQNGKNVTLDLNGHTLSRSLENAAEDGCVIKVIGDSLTLIDSSATDENPLGTGKITGGWNSCEGGGVFVGGSATFTMHGGTITGNSAANGGGVYVAENGVFKVSGSVVITGNTDGAESPKSNNVYLSAGTVVELDGALAIGTRIGMTTGTAPTAETPITITSGFSGNGNVSNFFSDNTTYLMGADESGEAVLSVGMTWAELKKALEDADEWSDPVTLTNDVTRDDDESLQCDGGTLDLNGYTIDPGEIHETMIRVGGSFTITDSSGGAGRILCPVGVWNAIAVPDAPAR